MIQRTAFSDIYLEDQLPVLEGSIYEGLERYPELYSRIFNVVKTGRDIMQRTTVSGLGLLSKVSENGAVTYDTPVQGFDKTYKPVQWASGFKTSRLAFDDDKYGLIREMGDDLGISTHETIEREAADVFNNGFTTTGPDGKTLFATDHPNPYGGGTQANRPTNHVDISQPAIEAALIDMRKWNDESGRRMRCIPQFLLIPPDLEFIASELLNSDTRSDTADRATNALLHRVGFGPFKQIEVNEFLTDVDAWFILSEKRQHKLTFVSREEPNTVHGEDFDTRGLKTAIWTRFDVGYHGWRGAWGTAGG